MTDAEKRPPYILVADDYSTAARTAADAAIRIARIQNLAIRGLYVVDEVLALDTYANYHTELPFVSRKSNGERREPGSRAELMRWFETQGEVALNRLQSACVEAGVPVDTSLIAGGVPEMVIRDAARAQMLALGRRDLQFPQNCASGASAYARGRLDKPLPESPAVGLSRPGALR